MLRYDIVGLSYLPDRGMLLLAFLMMGLVIIPVGMWGVWHGSSTHVRVYLTYLNATLVADLGIVAFFLMKTSCPAHEAYVCGVNRILSALGLVVSIFSQTYIVFVIQSYINELANQGGPELKDLLVGRAVDEQKRMNEICYATSHIYGDEGSMNNLLSAEYGAVVQGEMYTGFGGAHRVFGTKHDIGYSFAA
eukprot:CAMPEP_0194486556 /NCGR_PEP_ID=MMETSP0253-20130528/7153_1 /TAXON_ID=2966 /ORGANISM="Noctiluca scintillans" /LENGTH=191 /DNA_ID=CAMNT_0039326653 /DNA_START=237 /DNA_END=812 /DNA_ORIENTATION=-